MSTMSARELNRDVSAAKRAALHGPVVITDRGEEAFVLLSIEEYRRLRADSQDLVARLSMDDGDDFDFEPAPLDVALKVPEL
ncbi:MULTISPECIES: type II toxin-antitoxin system prevent-host-death family antitoxin [Nocardia]|uniref:Antitoxin n=1 Tax=Nocardia aurea TaxID=2144174 RepID=A0ABV3FWJ6_9NOCA|nr:MULTISPECIES: type II toxin-antitoxin system prevent-host-death family antitoxin [Nocardia]